MRFMIEYPLHSDVDGGSWIDPASMIRVAQTAEAAGFDGLALTDHPAPSKKWLDGGGHETLDPFVDLAFFAAATSSIRLMTFLAVVPYRNPLLLAKSMTAVDVVSGGRTTYVLGTGYLRSEFAALGADFDERNVLFDEAVDVLRALWSTDELHYDGRHFKAIGVTLKPGAVQQPHPPLWLGGNAKVVLQRAAAWGQGWAPMLGASPTTTRTRGIESNEQLAAMIADIKEGMAAAGRDPSTLDVMTGGTSPLLPGASKERWLDHLGRLAGIGVTWCPFALPHSSVAEAIDALESHAEVIAAVR